MFGLIAGIVGLIAAGCLVSYAVAVTFKWLKDKIKEKFFTEDPPPEVFVGELGALVDKCGNVRTFKEFLEGGYTHVMGSIDANGKVSDVELIRDTSDTTDDKVEQFINRTNEGMVIIKA